MKVSSPRAYLIIITTVLTLVGYAVLALVYWLCSRSISADLLVHKVITLTEAFMMRTALTYACFIAAWLLSFVSFGFVLLYFFLNRYQAARLEAINDHLGPASSRTHRDIACFATGLIGLLGLTWLSLSVLGPNFPQKLISVLRSFM